MVRALQTVLARVAALVAVGIVLAPAALATTALSQGYAGNENPTPGMIVSIDPNQPNTVVPSNTQRAEALLGVVVPPANALLEVTDSGHEVQVASTGIATAFVSDLNGRIKAGDRIAPSPISGVGMKALVSGRVVGVAQADFDASKADKKEIQTSTGKQQVLVGEVPVIIGVTYYSAPTDSKSVVPEALQGLANALAGKQVSASRILVSVLMMVFAVIAVTTLLFASAQTSITSIGRNPLSSRAIHSSLLQVLGLSVLILIVTLTVVYFILSH